MEYKKYSYSGPVYYCGNKQVSKIPTVYTMAKSYSQAYKNILFKVANDGEIRCYDIDRGSIKIESPIIKTSYEFIPTKPKCEICGYELADNGECPVCDFGEYSLLYDD